MPKGKRECPKCSTINGARSIFCSSCGEQFVRKEQKPKKLRKARIKKEKINDINELQKGDRIKVKNGPYYIAKEGQEDEEKIYMGERGVFTVVGLDKDGIWGRSKELIVSYIYTGKEVKSKYGTYLRPHQVVRLHKTV